MAIYPSSLIVSAFAIALAPSGQACAGFLLEGDAASLTVVADKAPLSAVIAEITRRLGVQSRGAAVPEDLVSGTFTGNLSRVLNAILPHNGFVIAYSDGEPVAVTFTGRASKSLQPEMQTSDKPIGNRPDMGAVARTGLMPSQPVGAAGDHATPATDTGNNRNNAPPITDGATAGPAARVADAPLIAINDPLHLVTTEGN